MGKNITCVECQNTFQKNAFRHNPDKCKECGTLLNVITRAVKIPLGGFDNELAEITTANFNEIGSWCLERACRWIKRWHMLDGAVGTCAECEKEQELWYEKWDKHFCSKCMQNVTFGTRAQGTLFKLAKDHFPLQENTRLVMVRSAARYALEMAETWFKENRRALAFEARRDAKFAACKARALKLKRSRGEPLRVFRIRHKWATSRKMQCLSMFFDWHVLARDANQRHRAPRRERLKRLNVEFALLPDDPQKNAVTEGAPRKPPKRKRQIKTKVTDVAWALLKPVCGDCKELERYEWGYECKLHNPKIHPPPADFPAFPRSLVKLQGKSYQIGSRHAEIPLWEKGPKAPARIMGRQWLTRYGFPKFDNSVYATLWKDPKVREPRWFLIYFITEVIKVEPGDLLHVAVNGPTVSCVWSTNGNGTNRARYFRHGEILSIKEYFAAQRTNAKGEYFRKPRLTEARRVRDILHTESATIVSALADEPARIIIVDAEKSPYDRTNDEKKKFNTGLGRWPAYEFKKLLGYKSERAGLRVEARPFALKDPAACPYCQSAAGSSWQELIIEEQVRNLDCPECGRNTNVMLAIAQTVAQQVREEPFDPSEPGKLKVATRKKKRGKQKQKKEPITVES